MGEETLRLQFGTAATTIGTQWLALQQANGDAKRPHVLAFEAKGRVQSPIRATHQHQGDPSTWGGTVQVYDQSHGESATLSNDSLWDWKELKEHNLVEIDEFRPHLPLHNFYEGHAVSHGGNITRATLEMAEDRVRTVLETCDQLRLVQGLVDMDSSWGGLAHELMSYVVDECPAAVFMIIGNDWSYPLSLDDKDAMLASSRGDRTKLEARKRVNVASSMALLANVSHLQVPLAMSPTTLRKTTVPHIRFDRTSCADVSAVMATALELALAGYRTQPVDRLIEDFSGYMRVLEVATSFPYTTDPTRFFQPTGSHINKRHAWRPDPFGIYSLLPTLDHAPLAKTQLHKFFCEYWLLRGAFNGTPSLQATTDLFVDSSDDVALRWSPSPLLTPTSYRLATRSSEIEAISRLSASSAVGQYLTTLGHQVAGTNKRVLHEFTSAGMSPDALEELSSTLEAKGGEYWNWNY